MFIPSKFNYLYVSNNKTIIYNSLSKILLITDKDDSDVRKYENISADTRIRKFLLDHHFLVHSDIDENAVAKLYRMEEVMKNDLQVMILPTSACNFQCVYCYETMKSFHMNKETQNRVKMFFNREVRYHRLVHVEWFGGEPLVQKELVYDLSESIISTCQRYGKPYRASITTNGYLLDIATFQRLLGYHVYTYCITLDGPSAVHDKLRPQKDGKGSFHKIIQNLLDIKNKIISHYFTIVLRINVTKDLLECFEDFLEFLRYHFDDDPRFTFMFRIVGDYGGDRIAEIRSHLLDTVDVVYDQLLRSKITLDYRAHYALLSNSVCSAAKRHAYTLYMDGSIYKCNSLVGDEKGYIGSLGQHGELIIDEGLLSRWIATNCNNDQKKCVDCKFAPSCNNCPTKEHVMNGERPCIYTENRLDKLLELLTRGLEKRQYGFVYKLDKGEIISC